jgi:hypothetical protein
MRGRAFGWAAIAAVAALAGVRCLGDDTNPVGNDGGDAALSESGPDAPATDGGAEAGPCGTQSSCPAVIDPSHLQLWLEGDVGVDCPAHRITTWHDQSTHKRDAVPTTTADGGAVLPPECNEDTISNLPVASFTDPTPSPAILQDETLQVDLGFLKNSDFTIAIVHKQTAYLLAAGLLSFANLPPIAHCGSSTGVQNTGALELLINHTDTTGANEVYHVSHDCPALDVAYPTTATMAPVLTEYTYDSVAGTRMFINSTEVTNGTSSLTGVTQDGGEVSLIGRGSNLMTVNTTVSTIDTRYKGDIAEIIAYDAALTDADRKQLETYLKVKWVLAF